MRETKKAIVNDIMICIKWIAENNKFNELVKYRKKVNFVYYVSDRLTFNSLMKNKKADLLELRYNLLENIIY